jgi:FixJ family two-component response regulator
LDLQNDFQARFTYEARDWRGKSCDARILKLAKSVTISVVDDDSWARDGVRELVESLGYQAFAFASAEQFLESGLLDKTACLITDVQMPGLSGLDLQHELGSKGYRIPIIFITAYPDERRREHALSAGAIGFLTKPFDERSLIDCLTLAVAAPH